MNLDKRTEIFRRLREVNPHPKTELKYRTPFQLLIAVMLSAQATDVGEPAENSHPGRSNS